MGESVNVSYLGTWIVAKGVGWPHDGLVVHQSRLSHHGSHVRRLTGKKVGKIMRSSTSSVQTNKLTQDVGGQMDGYTGGT